ncbi:MAG: flagellar hook protein FlgE [Proteobacteria bacterium]|nr:flagellar hook protein FlgE [Pseudomonadota bacterium]MBU1709102.1 flagellar hook protein FlgE [Pseudomonadota bacterium]
MLTGIYSSLSGLLGLSRKVETTANNVANLNTPGFKASRVNLEDASSPSVSTASGTSQTGRGVVVGSISRTFNQGYLESSANPTDMAIGGQGFFMLRQPGASVADKFTRSGGFRFDQQGSLVTPEGYHVQGWSINPETGDRQGSIGDIILEQNTPPVATHRIEQIVNLDSRTPKESTDINLYEAWDGRNSTSANPSDPIAANNYDYKSSLQIHDAQGERHDITIYFDRTTNDNEWEYLVTADPLQDQRRFNANQQAAFPPFDKITASDHKGAGALMYGTLNFNASGEIRDISAYDVPPDAQVDPSLSTNRISLGNSDPYYSFQTNFTGAENNQAIELNLGARFSGQDSLFLAESLATTQYANSSTTIYQNQNGFAAGNLQSLAVGPDGVISGRYSNGQQLQKAQVALASFANLQGLRSDGGNLYSQTTASGVPMTGSPGTGGLGSIAPNALEQSNVELAEELPNLMITKRSFQANLKVLKAEDEMLGSLLDIKG